MSAVIEVSFQDLSIADLYNPSARARWKSSRRSRLKTT